MNKPTNPNITIPESFAANGVKADFDNNKILNGFDRIQPDVLAGDNLNKFIDDTYKGLNYSMAASDALNILEDGHTLIYKDGEIQSQLVQGLNGKITNCITEIPQRLKYTLENGTLTIKAGTVLIVPYGTEDLRATYPIGSTFIHENFKVVDTQYIVGDGGIIDSKFFVWVEVQNAIAYTFTSNTTTISNNILGINFTINSFYWGGESTVASGTSYASDTTHGIYYDYAINTIKFRSTTSSDWHNAVFSLPVLNFTRTSGVPTAINKVFNGYGYIGSVRWIDKGIKALFSIGKNPDGTYINEEFVSALRMETTPSSSRTSVISSALRNQMFYRGKGDYCEQSKEPTKVAYLMWFNPDTGLTKRCLEIDGVLQWVDYPSCKLYDFTFDGTYYTEFSGRTAFRAADWNELRDYATNPATTLSSASNARPAVVVQNYVSGTSWYRVWSDGWIEQGGVASSVTGDGNSTITLLKSFSNTNFSVTATIRNSAFSTQKDAGVGAIPTAVNKIILRNTVESAMNINWVAEGY